MKQVFDVTVEFNLGDHEKPYKMLFYIGGFDGVSPPMSQQQFSSPTDQTFRITVKFPKNRAKLLPSDVALVCMLLVRVNTEDDRHKQQLGCQEAGTVILPLKGFKEANVDLVFYPGQLIYRAIDFKKCRMTIRAVTPIPESRFALPTKYSVDHNKSLDDKSLLRAVLVGQRAYSEKTVAVYDEIKEIPCMPSWRFDKNLEVPGYMLSCNRNPTNHSPDWWRSLIGMGVKRVYPFITGKNSLRHLTEKVNTDLELTAVGVAACSIPANYWRYASDETEVKSKKLTCENYTPLSRFKLGIITTVDAQGKKKQQYITPGDDCENDGDDIRLLLREFQTLKLDPKTHPDLVKVQSALKSYVVTQTLTGVHGAKESDGDASSGKAPIGLHSMSDVIHKQLFVTAHSRVNSAEDPFDGWLREYNPKTPIDPKIHSPLSGEGTGTIDPLGDDYRNIALSAYGSVLGGQHKEALQDLKIVMPTSRKKITDTENFYVSKVSMVVPEMIEQGFESCMFTPVTVEKKKVVRMVTHEDFMTCSPKVGLRIEPPVTTDQAMLIKHIHSFYPPITNFEAPEPLETSEVRQRYKSMMATIPVTMEKLNRVQPPNTVKLVADFYPAYYQLTQARVAAICDIIKSTPEIIGVEVEEEAVAKYLGGYRIAFSVAVASTPKVSK